VISPGPKLQALDGALVVDVRKIIPRNPYRNDSLRNLRGDHPDVIADILKNPGLARGYAGLLELVKDFGGEVYVGCTGGHHRSVYVADRLGRELGVAVTHLNYADK
jgi:UPF0042 nucleotide-binding protein